MADARARFQEVLATLRAAGFENLRVDTLAHPVDAGVRRRPTVRHQYAGGEFELHFEPDQTTDRHERRTVRIRVNHELPTVKQAVSELFGDRLQDYFHLHAPIAQEA
jgi:hypothetical protein